MRDAASAAPCSPGSSGRPAAAAPPTSCSKSGADNPRAQQLYLRFGFEQIHIRPRYYRDGVDALIMRLQLAGDETTGDEATEAGRQ